MWKTILCGFVIVVASTAVSGQSTTEGASDTPRGEIVLAQDTGRPMPAVKARYDARCGANARRVQVDLRGSIDGGARCLRESREEE